MSLSKSSFGINKSSKAIDPQLPLAVGATDVVGNDTRQAITLVESF